MARNTIRQDAEVCRPRRILITCNLTIRAEGILESGKPSDINFSEIFERLYAKSAYFVMKNTNALVSKEFEEIKIDAKDVGDVEERLIKEHLGQVKVEGLGIEQEKGLIMELMKALSVESAMKSAPF